LAAKIFPVDKYAYLNMSILCKNHDIFMKLPRSLLGKGLGGQIFLRTGAINTPVTTENAAIARFGFEDPAARWTAVKLLG